MGDRTALLLRCSVEQAKIIHERAESERRTVAAYVLNVVMRAIELEERLLLRLTHYRELNRILSRRALLDPGPRTAILLRCSKEEAGRIRMAAKRRDMSISGFILHSLRRSWQVNPKY
jgi:uncharacterized protein (DUF1778 family)